MKSTVQSVLLLANVFTILLIGVVHLLPDSILRAILGLPLLLFFPGYALLAALLPRRGFLETIERVALSFALSIAVVALTGLFLNAMPWGIRLYPILVCLAVFVFVASAIAWYRQRRPPENERLAVSVNLSLAWWRERSTLNKYLSVVLAVVMVGAIGTLVFMAATPRAEESFTEFYILGTEGNMDSYPHSIRLGEDVSITVGITNNEHGTMSYRVVVYMNGDRNQELGPYLLEHGETHEQAARLTPTTAGGRRKVELVLYKNDEDEPCLEPLYLWLDAEEPVGTME